MDTADNPAASAATAPTAAPVPLIAASAAPQLTESPAGVAEMSPNKRYIRFDEVISSTGEDSIQDSYKAFDTKNGIEVAWHTIDLNSLAESDQIGVTQCVNILKRIQDKHVIEYLACWFRAESRTLNVITTHLDSLKEFIGKVVTLRWRIVKKWCRQILRGLDHLHSHSPQIIHRSLTCSNIYIDSGLSATNIGDLWLAAVIPEEQGPPVGLSDVVITDLAKKRSPAFIAPEQYEAGSKVSSKADVYSFGMCAISMITRDEPYQECEGNLAKLQSKVMAGRPPRAINSIPSPLAREFISQCLRPAAERPTAAQLLQHPFLVITSEDDGQVILEPPETVEPPESTSTSQIMNVDLLTFQTLIDGAAPSRAHSKPTAAAEVAVEAHLVEGSRSWNALLGKELADLDVGENVHVDRGLHDGRRAADDAPVEAAAPGGDRGDGGQTEEKEKATGHHTTELQLKIIIPGSKTRERAADKEVEFTFDVLKDNFRTVASEMIEELRLALSVEELAAQIATVVVKPHMAVRLAALPNLSPKTSVLELAEERAASNSVSQPLADTPTAAPAAAVTTIEARKADTTAAPAATAAAATPPQEGSPISAERAVELGPAAPEPSLVEAPSPPICQDPLPDPALLNPVSEASSLAVDSAERDASAPPPPPLVSTEPPRRDIEPAVETDLLLLNLDDVERELEKLDKESRVARRAFEQRIQKHKSIQGQCQEEYLRVEEEYASKRSELERKLESAARRRDEEVAKLQAELEARLQECRERILMECRAERARNS